MIKFFDPGKAYLKIKSEIDAAIERVLTNGDLILRKDVEEFEEKLADFVGTKYAVGLNSGTDALYLALKAMGVTGEEVAVPSHTFVATAQVVEQVGATPVLYDLGEQPQDTRVKMITHIAGELSPITHGLVIEDACQALGAVKNPITDAQCWSFYPAKILGAYGDAGGLTTNSLSIYEYVREARNHFKTDYSKWGINSRMDNLQAAILNVKFKYLPQVLERRKQIAEFYLVELKGLPIKLPNNTQGRVWQDFIIGTERRDELFDFLKVAGIETMRNEYPFPIPKLPKSIGYEKATLRLPINEVVEDGEIQYVCQKIKEFYV